MVKAQRLTAPRTRWLRVGLNDPLQARLINFVGMSARKQVGILYSVVSDAFKAHNTIVVALHFTLSPLVALMRQLLNDDQSGTTLAIFRSS